MRVSKDGLGVLLKGGLIIVAQNKDQSLESGKAVGDNHRVDVLLGVGQIND